MKPIPEINKTYHFFGDGKISYSRHYLAKVIKIITPDKAKNIIYNNENLYEL